MSSTPVIVVISMGGTIAMVPAASGGVGPGLDADALIASVPGLGELDIEIVTQALRGLPSPSIGFDDLVALAEAVREAARPGGAPADVTTDYGAVGRRGHLRVIPPRN